METLTQDEAMRTALKETRRSGVDLARIPPEALELLTDANLPAEDHMMLRPRGWKRRR